MRKIVTEVFSYDELDEKAKQNVLEDFATINVEDGYWYLNDLVVLDRLKAAGIGISQREMSFDIDRASYAYFDTHRGQYGEPGIWIEDHAKLANALHRAGVWPKKEMKKILKAIEAGEMRFAINCAHYGGGVGKNTLEIDDPHDWSYQTCEKIQQWIDRMMSELVKELRSEYDSLTSREAIEDTILANEYEFTKEGKRV